MIRPLLLSIFIIALFQLTACEQKQVWKLPAKATIALNLLPQGGGGPSNLTFTEGQIILSKVYVEGSINQANNFRFERNFPVGLIVDFNSTAILEELKFDIPQGDYLDLNISFETKPTEKTINVGGVFDYNNPNKADALIHFEFDSLQIFNINIKKPQGSSLFNITDSTNNNIEILLNPPFWFKNVTATMMNNANTTIINNQSHILINKTSNNNIYQDAKGRIGVDAKSTLN